MSATANTIPFPPPMKMSGTLSMSGNGHRKDIQKVIEAFDKYCIGEINVTYERYFFNRRNQDTAESFDTFMSV
jgi:hypothetical protein